MAASQAEHWWGSWRRQPQLSSLAFHPALGTDPGAQTRHQPQPFLTATMSSPLAASDTDSVLLPLASSFKSL